MVMSLSQEEICGGHAQRVPLILNFHKRPPEKGFAQVLEEKRRIERIVLEEVEVHAVPMTDLERQRSASR